MGLYCARPTLVEEFDHAAFLGDEGVDAAGFGVEVVSDRPLLSKRRDPYAKIAEFRGIDRGIRNSNRFWLRPPQ